MMYESIIGLEIHVQLNTNSKLFCACPNQFGKKENTLICPICIGYPGTLPQLNENAVEKAIQLALAVNANVQKFSRFDRKHYFYPDLPKGYQITQFYFPIAKDGFLNIEYENKIKKIELDHLHIEEDAGKLIHQENESLVDLNRAGVPLVEIVTKPILRDPKEVILFLMTLKQYIQYSKASECSMEKGFFRCDANISLREHGNKNYNEKVEIKNLNSFKSIQNALYYEIERQSKILETGKKVISESRLYDIDQQKTLSMRSKESAIDYRYLVEPDVSIITLNDDDISKCKRKLPELPYEKEIRYENEYQISKLNRKLLIQDIHINEYFESCLSYKVHAEKLANWLKGEVFSLLNEHSITIREFPISAKDLAHLLKEVENEKLHISNAKEIFKELFKEPKNLSLLLKKFQFDNEDQLIHEIVQNILKKYPKEVEMYKNGKENLLGFLIGQVLRSSKEKLNPQKVKNNLLNQLKNII